MSRNHRYLRTERRRTADQPADQDADTERIQEERARYGGFATWFVGLLLVATVAAVIGAVVFWPD